jgi:hypothetical protein
MVGGDIPVSADAPAAFEQSSVSRSQISSAALDAAKDFSLFLKEIEQRDVGPVQNTRLSELLAAFDDLARDMRAASTEIRQLLSHSG